MEPTVDIAAQICTVVPSRRIWSTLKCDGSLICMSERKNVHPTAVLHVDEGRGRAELWDTVDGEKTCIGFIGFAQTSFDGAEVWRLQHTIVDPAFGQQGYARCLVTLLLDRIETEGGRFVSECSYVDHYLHRYPEYRRLEATVG